MKHLRPFNEMNDYLIIPKMEEIITSHLKNFPEDLKDTLWDVIDEFDIEFNQFMGSNSIFGRIKVYKKNTTNNQIMTENDDMLIDSFDFSFSNEKEIFSKEYGTNERYEKLSHFLHNDAYRIVMVLYQRLTIPKKIPFEIEEMLFYSETMKSSRDVNRRPKYHFNKTSPPVMNLNPLENELIELTPIIQKNLDCEFMFYIEPRKESIGSTSDILFMILIPIK